MKSLPVALLGLTGCTVLLGLEGEYRDHVEKHDDAGAATIDAATTSIDAARADAGSIAMPGPTILSAWDHTCAVRDGGVRCWGRNSHGQLGLGDTRARGVDAGDMQDVRALDLGGVAIEVAAGGVHTCVVFADGGSRLKCFGGANNGATGLESAETFGDQPGEVPALPWIDLGKGRTAVAVETAESHTCAILDDGSVKCWGFGTHGGNGIGETKHRGLVAGDMGDALPTVDLGRRARALAVSEGYACALLEDARVKCWGANAYGQLGLGDTAARGDEAGEMARVADVDLGASAIQIAAGSEHTCALLAGGAVKCWGRQDSAQLGSGATRHVGGPVDAGFGPMGDALAPVKLDGPAIAIALGYSFSCALLADGRVTCWGANGYGQLGRGESGARFGDSPLHTFKAVSLGERAVSLTAGHDHACALLASGAIKCWGRNDVGQLGVEDRVNRGLVPEELPPVKLLP